MRHLLLFIILGIVACASPLLAGQCGSFTQQKTTTKIEFSSDGVAREYGENGLVRNRYRHVRDGQTVFLENVETGLRDSYQLSGDAKKLTAIDTTWNPDPYISQRPYSCAPQQQYIYLKKSTCEYGKEAQCCTDGDQAACVKEAANSAEMAKLQQLCATRPDACLALLDTYRKNLKSDSDLFNMYAEKKPLPDGQLNDILQACLAHRTPDLCRKASEELWRARQFGQTRDLLGKMCEFKLEEHSCSRFNQLNSVQFPNELSPATTLPCGEFKSTVSSLTGDLTFGNRGAVQLGIGSSLRARLEAGQIRIRHDKGGDFILAPLSDRMLLGLDEWNQMEVYTRQALPEKACQTPIIYREQELSSSCGLDMNPEDCCRKGDTQGCNRLGNMAALANNWKEAAEKYAQVCGKGVRVGCENWIYTVSKTGDGDGVESGLKRLCKNDDRHVACDLLEQGKLRQMIMGYELEKMLKEAEKKVQ